MPVVECPYSEGAKYTLDFMPGTRLDQPFRSTSKLQVTVLQAFKPFTISPVLRVKLDSADPAINIPSGSTLIFKLFDHRFATDLRKYHDVPDLTTELAAEYLTFSSKPESKKSFEEWDEKRIELENDDKELAPLEKEAHLDAQLTSYFRCEVKVYDRLAALQGKGIPKFYGQTRFITNVSSHPAVQSFVPGILLEYVEGQILENLPPGQFKDEIATSALDIVTAFANAEVLNRDVRLENFLVPASQPGRPVVMIDFAQCRLREKGVSDKEWFDEKASQDEEGAVGYMVNKKFGWQYVPSRRYQILAEE